MKRRSRALYHCFDEVDALTFTHLLREKFPNIRFVRMQYWEFPEGEGPFSWNNLPGPENLHYMDSLADPRDWRFQCWLQPNDWSPVWIGPNEYGIFYVLNEPVFQFTFERAWIAPLAPDELGQGRVWAFWDETDAEHRRFFEKVMRLVKKLGNDVLVPFGAYAERLGTEPRHTRLWAGPHAIEWCLADRKRSIEGRYRPPEPDEGDT